MMLKVQGTILSYIVVSRIADLHIFTCCRGFLGTSCWADVSIELVGGRTGSIVLEKTRIFQILPSQCDWLG